MAGTSNSGGRNAKDRRLHVLQGTFRPDRHGDQVTPDPPKGKPTPPKQLGKVARAEWDRMVTRLETAGTLTVVDDAALFQYVQLFAETEEIKVDNANYRKLSIELKKMAGEKLDGHQLVEAIGRIVELQQIIAKTTTQLRQGHMAIRQYLVEFGMTPSARSRVKLPPDASKRAPTGKERFFGAS